MITLKHFSRQLLLKVQAVKILLEERSLEEAKRELEKLLEILGERTNGSSRLHT